MRSAQQNVTILRAVEDILVWVGVVSAYIPITGEIEYISLNLTAILCRCHCRLLRAVSLLTRISVRRLVHFIRIETSR